VLQKIECLGFFLQSSIKGLGNIGIIKTGKETFVRLSKSIAASDKSTVALSQTLLSCSSRTMKQQKSHQDSWHVRGKSQAGASLFKRS